MAIDPARNQLEYTKKQNEKQCERTLVTQLTKTRADYYLKPRALLISVVLVGSLLMPLSIPISFSSGAPATLAANPSNSRVQLGHMFSMAESLTPNNKAISGSDMKIQRYTLSQTPIAGTNHVNATYDYAAGAGSNRIYSHKAIYNGNNFFNKSKSHLEHIASENAPTLATNLSVKMQDIRNVTELTISQKNLINGSFVISGRLERTTPVWPGQITIGVGYQIINLYRIDNSNKTYINSTTTDIDGNYSFNAPGSGVYFTSFDGDSTDLSSTSATLRVNT